MIYALRSALPTAPLHATLHTHGTLCGVPGSEYTADAIAIERLSATRGDEVPAFKAVIGAVVPPDGSTYDWADARSSASADFVARAGWLLRCGYPAIDAHAFFEAADVDAMRWGLDAVDAYAVTQSVLWWLRDELGEVYTHFYRCDSLGALHEKNEALHEAARHWWERALEALPTLPPGLYAEYEVVDTPSGLSIGPFQLAMPRGAELTAATASVSGDVPYYVVDRYGCLLHEIGEGIFYVRVPSPCRATATLRVNGTARQDGIVALRYAAQNAPPEGLERVQAAAQLWVAGEERFAFEVEVPLNVAPTWG